MNLQPALSARLRIGGTFLVTAFALTLVACQGSGAVGTIPTTEPVATPTASATPTPAAVYKPADAQGKAQNVPMPEKPALADENSKAGLEAFVGYWFALLNYAYETGDLSDWSALAEKGCAFCTKLEEVVYAATADGRWMVGGTFSTPRVEAKWKETSASQPVIVQVMQTKIDYFKVDGSSAGPTTAETNVGSGVTAVFVDEHWTVQDMAILR